MFKKHRFIIYGALIIIVVFAIFAGIQVNESSYFKKLAIEQATNDVNLTAMDLNSQITNMSTEQRVVSQMMANDIFLLRWCEEENEDTESAHAKELYEYLKTYQLKYNYDVVFFVSNKTYNYYYNDGLNKVVSRDSEFDSWYFNFLNLNQEYDIQIDHDEVNDYGVSLFVNCLVVDKDGNTIGVVGVGNKIDDFEASVSSLTDSLSINAGIVNKGNAHNSFTGSSGFYMTASDAAANFNISEEDVLKNVGTQGSTWTDGYLCTTVYHNKDLNWNIIVQKNTKELVASMLEQTYGRFVFMISTTLAVSIVCVILLSRLNRATRFNENIDELTGLINAKLFREIFQEKRKKRFHQKKSCLFVLDIDNFKHFNDTYGHMYGNTIIRMMASNLKDLIASDGVVCRWGGDEFIGIIYHNVAESKIMMDELQCMVNKLETRSPLSFSCGITKINNHKSLEENFKLADSALYTSKENGKGQVTVAKAR
jgi:diguanylate cyclase (GGDEF)-like protein